MKPAQLKELYVEACRARRVVPQDAEYRDWKETLGDFSKDDVARAIRLWFEDPVEGKWLPKAGQLKPLVEREERLREVKSRVDYCGECALGWVMILRDGQLVKAPCSCRERVLAAVRGAKQMYQPATAAQGELL